MVLRWSNSVYEEGKSGRKVFSYVQNWLCVGVYSLCLCI